MIVLIIFSVVLSCLCIGLTFYILYQKGLFSFNSINVNSIGNQENNSGTIVNSQNISNSNNKINSNNIIYKDGNGNSIKVKGEGNGVEVTQTSVNGKKRNKVVIDGITIIDQINEDD